MTVNTMKKWMIVPIMGAVWLLALLYQSGIGNVYNVYGKSEYLVVAAVIAHLLACGRLKKVPQREFLILGYILGATLLTTFIFRKNMLDYIWLFGITYLLSFLHVEKGAMRMASLMYGILGMAVLYIWNYGSAFRGWNENSLAMIAFFSFSVMIVSFTKTKQLTVIFILVGYIFLYFVWSESLNSRSGTLFAIILFLGIWRIIPFHKLLSKKNMILLLLLLPLIIAVFIVLIRNQEFVKDLDSWSRMTFQKPIFNGRDTLWYEGFLRWLQSPLIGNGNLSAANWHNSAVTMLVGGGAIGYCIWIFVIHNILKKGIDFLDDYIVYGLMLGFICIWFQQTVELGLVAGQANAIPYAMLGLLIGRVRTLEREDENNNINYCTSI